MKKNIYLNLLTFVILFFVFLNPTFAQENEPVEPAPASDNSEDSIDTEPEVDPIWTLLTFAEMGIVEETLERSNFSTTNTIHLPAHWSLLEGSELHLELLPLVRQDGIVVQNNLFGGTIIVKFEGEIIGEHIVNSNEKIEMDLRIPESRFIDDGRRSYALEVTLLSDFNCGSTLTSSVQILDTSYFSIAYHEVLPLLDLRMLPFPIQQNSFQPNVGTFVIPDETSEAELTALLTTASGMGRSTTRTTFDLVRESDLTDQIKFSSHLIFVGDYRDFVSSEMIFNSEDSALLESVNADEGILKLTHSPWDESKAILHISGLTTEGVQKAANALTFGVIRPATDRFDFAIIEEVVVEEAAPSEIFSPLFSFADLGHDVQTMFGPNDAQTQYKFNIPTERPFSLAENGELSLLFNHSDLLNYDSSGINILLNNRPIGSSHFSNETTDVTRLTIEIPEGFLRNGSNTLAINANLEPITPCSNFADDGTWVNIFPESEISLPIIFNDEPTAQPVSIISAYPKPFSTRNDLGNTTFVLPEDNIDSLFGALQIAFNLGKHASSDILQLKVLYSDDISEEVLNTDHLIVVGQALDQPFITSINEALPGPFIENTNLIQSDRLPIEYRLPADDALGYLQMVASPWNTDLSILLVGGVDDEGVQVATTTLLNNQRQLGGDLVVIDQNGVFTTVTPEIFVADESTDTDEEAIDEEAMSEDDANLAATSEAGDEPSKTAANNTLEEAEEAVEQVEGPKEEPVEETIEEPEETEETEEAEEETAVITEQEPPDESTAVESRESDTTVTSTQTASSRNSRFSISSIPRLPMMVIATGMVALLLIGGGYLVNRRTS